MGVYTCTAFYGEAQFSAGWTESYYTVAPDATTAQSQFAAMLTLRVDWLMDTTAILGYRVSVEGAPRDGIVQPFTPANGLLPSATNPRAGMEDVLLVRLDNPEMKYFNYKYFHIVPESLFTGRRVITTSWPPAFMTAFSNWITEMKSGRWMLHSQAVPAGTVLPSITQVVPRIRTRRALGRPSFLPHGRRAAG